MESSHLRAGHAERPRPFLRLTAAGAVLSAAVAVVACADVQHGDTTRPAAKQTHATAAHAPAAPRSVSSPERTTTTAAEPGFSLVVTGDILLHERMWPAAAAAGTAAGERYDFTPMFANVQPVIAGADLALCHLETPLSSDDHHLASYPTFSVPYEIAPAIAAAGYDGCSTASNHSYDQGDGGVRATLDHLDAAHVAHAGSARSAAEAEAAVVHTFTVHGIAVAHLAYTFGLNNGLRAPSWEVRIARAAAIEADAHRARAAGAQFVIVSVHWGTEYSSTPNAFQRTLADALTASPDIDLVIGHHAHVVQPVVRLHAKFVAYGLGNFLSGQSKDTCPCPASSQDGVILRFRVQQTTPGHFAVARVEAIPTWVEHAGWTIVAAPPASAPRTLAALGPEVTLAPLVAPAR